MDWFALFFRGDKGIFCGKLAGMVSEGVHRQYSLSIYNYFDKAKAARFQKQIE